MIWTPALLTVLGIMAALGFWAGWVFGWAKGYREGAAEYRFPRGTIDASETNDFTTEKANHDGI